MIHSVSVFIYLSILHLRKLKTEAIQNIYSESDVAVNEYAEEDLNGDIVILVCYRNIKLKLLG